MKITIDLQQWDIDDLEYYDLKPYHEKAQRKMSRFVKRLLERVKKKVQAQTKG